VQLQLEQPMQVIWHDYVGVCLCNPHVVQAPDLILDDLTERDVRKNWFTCQASCCYQVDLTVRRIAMFAEVLAVKFVIRHRLIVLRLHNDLYLNNWVVRG